MSEYFPFITVLVPIFILILRYIFNQIKYDLVMEMWNKNKELVPPEVIVKFVWYRDMRDMKSFEEQFKFFDSLWIYIDREWKKRGFFGIMAQLRAKK